jgi:hypothetical protein
LQRNVEVYSDRDEIAWLVRIFEELVVGEETRVFWNQAQPGFPRHGGFLVVEEFDGGRKSGSVLILEGRRGEGWDLFGSVLRLVNEHFRAGVRLVAAEPEVQAVRGTRRSCHRWRRALVFLQGW